MSNTHERIAFLGIGLMGRPMAENLLTAGQPPTACTRTRASAAAPAAAGAALAARPADAGAAADIVITMLEDGPTVESVLFGAPAVAAALRPGTLFIDMSSIPPDTARRHAAALGARGIAYLDAPVSGGTRGAAAAALAIMAGGAAADFARAAPVLRRLGRPVHVGPAGTGQLAKLANQAIVAITIGAVGEALLLAAAGGADPAAVREALTGGFADSRILAEHGKRMLDRDFRPGGRSRIQLKDLDTILAAAAEAKVELPLSARVADLFRALIAGGGGEYDHSALLLQLERMSPPARVGAAPDRLSE